MQTVILCGGLGTRLREETEFIPKPMVEIGNKPILWHIMKIYDTYHFNNFILCLGYKGEIIRNYFYNYEIINSDFTIELGNHRKISIHDEHGEKGWKITLADTGLMALKGSRIKKIEKYIDSDLFMVTYGDGVANIDISKLVSYHKSHNCIGTVTGVRPLSRFGELIVSNNRVRSFIEKPQYSHGLINGGFFVFNKDIFNYLSEDDNCDFEIGPLEKLAKDDELRVYEHKGEWICMDTYRDMIYLNKLLENNEAFWKSW